MLKKLIKLIFGPHMSAEEKYLSKSADHFDLERRQRELQRKQFSGGDFKNLYNKFYI